MKRNNPNRGMDDSMISRGTGGIGDLVNPRESGKDWGKLSDRERDRILQSMSEGFPPEYRTVLERYYRRLAEEKRSPATEERPRRRRPKPRRPQPSSCEPGPFVVPTSETTGSPTGRPCLGSKRKSAARWCRTLDRGTNLDPQEPQNSTYNAYLMSRTLRASARLALGLRVSSALVFLRPFRPLEMRR